MLRELLLPLQNLMLSDEDIPSFGEVFGFFFTTKIVTCVLGRHGRNSEILYYG
jgi:hypothetical protein